MSDFIYSVDINKLFLPSHSLLEMIIRGTIVYLILVLLMRTIQRRHLGMISGADFLFVLLVAASSHYALTGGDTSITTGIIVILTIIGWNFFINWLSFHIPFFNRFLITAPVPLIKNGKIFKRNLHREFITQEELLTEMRKQGISDVSRIEEAHIEADGEISFVTYNRKRQSKSKKKVV